MDKRNWTRLVIGLLCGALAITTFISWILMLSAVGSPSQAGYLVDLSFSSVAGVFAASVFFMGLSASCIIDYSGAKNKYLSGIILIIAGGIALISGIIYMVDVIIDAGELSDAAREIRYIIGDINSARFIFNVSGGLILYSIIYPLFFGVVPILFGVGKILTSFKANKDKVIETI